MLILVKRRAFFTTFIPPLGFPPEIGPVSRSAWPGPANEVGHTVDALDGRARPVGAPARIPVFFRAVQPKLAPYHFYSGDQLRNAAALASLQWNFLADSFPIPHDQEETSDDKGDTEEAVGSPMSQNSRLR